MRGRRTLGSLLIFTVAAGVTLAFLLNFCNLLFACGCRSWWAGAAAHCNIHLAGKHCPWCTMPAEQFWSMAGLILAIQACFSIWPARWSILIRMTAALAAFPTTGLILGILMGYIKGYWT